MSVPPMQPPVPLDAGADLSPSAYYPPGTNDPAGGLPINLDSLRDGPPGSKPFYPYSTLIRYAIKGSPNQKLLLEDIYYAIESRFPYFRTAPSGWKNSVRHNLSLNPCFVKVPRPLTDRGKGSYWTVDDLVDPRTGVHRVRKRRGAKSAQASTDPEAAYEPPGGLGADGAGFGIAGESGARNGYDGADGGYDGEPAGLAPEMDEQGQPLWRNMWVNELIRLRAWTNDQDKNGVDPEWYRIMLLRVRHALQQIVPDAQTAAMAVSDQALGEGQPAQ